MTKRAAALEGKVSALVVEHLRHHPEDADWLLDILTRSREETQPEEIQHVIDVFRSSGTLDSVWERMYAIEEAIVSSPRLSNHPRLHALAVELVAMAVAPIAHTAPLSSFPMQTA